MNLGYSQDYGLGLLIVSGLELYFCVHNCTSPSKDYAAVAQQQPSTVTHSRISSLLITRCLTRPRVASQYSVGISSYFETEVLPSNNLPESVVTSGKIGTVSTVV